MQITWVALQSNRESKWSYCLHWYQYGVKWVFLELGVQEFVYSCSICVYELSWCLWFHCPYFQMLELNWGDALDFSHGN